jgi:hypothetical protein
VKRIIIAACFVLLMAVAPASAAIETTTTGLVCCSSHPEGQLEDFAGYTFKGQTSPSLAGQYVYFQYKRPLWTDWKNFKVLNVSTGKGFYVINKSGPRDRINDRNRWKVLFTPAVRQGYWKIRALFPQQGDYSRSQTIKKYWIWAEE